jgi:hypothetical protein
VMMALGLDGVCSGLLYGQQGRTFDEMMMYE